MQCIAIGPNVNVHPGIISVTIDCVIVHRVWIKKSLEYFGHNFIKYRPIFEILSLLQSAGNLQ